MSQIGRALKNYEGRGKGNLKPAGWQAKLMPFIDESSEVFIDPSDDEPPSYAMNSKALQFGFGDSSKIAVIESDADGMIIDIDNLDCDGGTEAAIDGTYAVRHLGMEETILERANVDLVGEYDPTPFGCGGYVRGVRPSDHALIQ